MDWNPSHRRLLRASITMTGAGLFQACGTGSTPQPVATDNPQKVKPAQPTSSSTVHHGDSVLHVVAPSGFVENINRVNIGLTRLYNVDFIVADQEVGSCRYQRFTGTDAQHIVDLQDIAVGRVRTPKVLMGLRDGYGATRILPHIDLTSLGAKIHEYGTLFFGFSDICTVQLTLLAKGNVPSFADPMVYSKFGKPQPSTYTMGSFIRDLTSASNTVDAPIIQRSDVNAEDTLWGGNLGVLVSLTGSPYMPDIQGGILFIGGVGEQPYHVKHMLDTPYLVGALQRQCAIIFDDFRMGTIRDIYDSSYDSPSVVSQIQRTAYVPVLTGFPFGHIVNKSAFPLDVYTRIRSSGNGGYSVMLSGYPTLNTATLSLNPLLPPLVTSGNHAPVGNGTTEEVLE